VCQGIVPIIFIGLLRKKEKFHLFTHLSNGLPICGLLFAVNYITFEVRYLTIMAMPVNIFPLSLATPHIWINWILLILTLMLFVLTIVFWKKDAIAVKRRVLYSSTVAVFMLFLFVLWQWNYFVMI